MNESGNTIEFARLPPGEIKYIAYDAAMDLTIGNQGGLALGKGFSGEQIVSIQEQFGPEPVTTRAQFTVVVNSLTSEAAEISVSF